MCHCVSVCVRVCQSACQDFTSPASGGVCGDPRPQVQRGAACNKLLGGSLVSRMGGSPWYVHMVLGTLPSHSIPQSGLDFLANLLLKLDGQLCSVYTFFAETHIVYPWKL